VTIFDHDCRSHHVAPVKFVGGRGGWNESVAMSLLIVLGALIFLMFVAYRGYSVILFAPIAARVNGFGLGRRCLL
jgi:hypothetical protein